MDPKQYHVCRTQLTAKRVESVVSIISDWCCQ